MSILTIVQAVIALVLIVIVLLQHGKQQGLSGAIAGGAETFFGKNKGRTIDALLSKFTTVVASLFIACTLVLTLSISGTLTPAADNGAGAPFTTETGEDSGLTYDAAGNLVTSDGTVVMTKEQLEQRAAQEGGENAVPPVSAPQGNGEQAGDKADFDAEGNLVDKDGRIISTRAQLEAAAAQPAQQEQPAQPAQ